MMSLYILMFYLFGRVVISIKISKLFVSVVLISLVLYLKKIKKFIVLSFINHMGSEMRVNICSIFSLGKDKSYLFLADIR